MKKKLSIVICTILLVVVCPASARGNRAKSPDYSPEIVVAATNGFNPSVLKAVRKNYCPASIYPWVATSRGLEFFCSREDNSSVLVDWEGTIFSYHTNSWSGEKTFKRLGTIENLKL